jgi:hypothetical protein
MEGEPDGAALAEVRLLPSSCDDVEQETKLRIKEMRAALAKSFEDWKKAQPDCWKAYRNMWGDEIGDSFGAGGLGLSGIGEGGGGYGEGIGLGSVATIGHGAGTGTGQGFGGGHGRVARSASGTNNQVAGVDEADIVKHDGRYVYLVLNGALRIVTATDPKLVSITRLAGPAKELFVEGDRAVVYLAHGGNGQPACTYGYDCQFAGDGSRTSIVVYDVTDRVRPRQVRQMDLSGSLLAARRIGTAVHTVVSDGDGTDQYYPSWPGDLAWCGTDESRVRAKFARLAFDNERRIRESAPSMPSITEKNVKRSLCQSVLRTSLGERGAFTSVVSFDLKDDRVPTESATLRSPPGAVFASANALYLSIRHQKRPESGAWHSFSPSSNELSEVHKFRIGKRPADTRYLGSGVVPGHVLNQFAMDEWYGYLRIATTKGRVPDSGVESAVNVLAENQQGNLVRVGAVEHIAPGEDIRAVRFDDDRAYVVTFKKTDPLFVLDLYHPNRPTILGELKIPGFSTYLHRIDRNHLLSIGLDANDHGDFAYFDGVILQLFDVRKPTEPKLLFKEKLGTRGSSSEALTNHLAFNYFGERNLLAIPMTLCQGGGDGQFGNELTFSGLLVYDVTTTRGFRRIGGVNHGAAGQSCTNWWSQGASAVKRSIFLDDLVFSIAPDRMKVQRLPRLGKDVADIRLL